jgi:hypothetical protein
VGLAGTLEAGRGIPRSEYVRRRLMSESGSKSAVGHVDSNVRLAPKRTRLVDL